MRILFRILTIIWIVGVVNGDCWCSGEESEYTVCRGRLSTSIAVARCPDSKFLIVRSLDLNPCQLNLPRLADRFEQITFPVSSCGRHYDPELCHPGCLTKTQQEKIKGCRPPISSCPTASPSPAVEEYKAFPSTPLNSSEPPLTTSTTGPSTTQPSAPLNTPKTSSTHPTPRRQSPSPTSTLGGQGSTSLSSTQHPTFRRKSPSPTSRQSSAPPSSTQRSTSRRTSPSPTSRQSPTPTSTPGGQSSTSTSSAQSLTSRRKTPSPTSRQSSATSSTTQRSTSRRTSPSPTSRQSPTPTSTPGGQSSTSPSSSQSLTSRRKTPNPTSRQSSPTPSSTQPSTSRRKSPTPTSRQRSTSTTTRKTPSTTVILTKRTRRSTYQTTQPPFWIWNPNRAEWVMNEFYMMKSTPSSTLKHKAKSTTNSPKQTYQPRYYWTTREPYGLQKSLVTLVSHVPSASAATKAIMAAEAISRAVSTTSSTSSTPTFPPTTASSPTKTLTTPTTPPTTTMTMESDDANWTSPMKTAILMTPPPVQASLDNYTKPYPVVTIDVLLFILVQPSLLSHTWDENTGLVAGLIATTAALLLTLLALSIYCYKNRGQAQAPVDFQVRYSRGRVRIPIRQGGDGTRDGEGAVTMEGGSESENGEEEEVEEDAQAPSNHQSPSTSANKAKFSSTGDSDDGEGPVTSTPNTTVIEAISNIASSLDDDDTNDTIIIITPGYRAVYTRDTEGNGSNGSEAESEKGPSSSMSNRNTETTREIGAFETDGVPQRPPHAPGLSLPPSHTHHLQYPPPAIQAQAAGGSIGAPPLQHPPPFIPQPRDQHQAGLRYQGQHQLMPYRPVLPAHSAPAPGQLLPRQTPLFVPPPLPYQYPPPGQLQPHQAPRIVPAPPPNPYPPPPFFPFYLPPPLYPHAPPLLALLPPPPAPRQTPPIRPPPQPPLRLLYFLNSTPFANGRVSTIAIEAENGEGRWGEREADGARGGINADAAKGAASDQTAGKPLSEPKNQAGSNGIQGGGRTRSGKQYAKK